MRKYRLKIFIGVYVILVIGVILFCLNFFSTISSMEKTVDTETQVLRQRLNSSDQGRSFEEPIETGGILKRVRNNWTQTPEVPDEALPNHVLMPPSDTN